MDLKATAVIGYTLIGVWGKPPHDRGNCFSVRADDGNEYKIVNFVHENLEALIAAGLTWPTGIRVLEGRTAVIHDRRIPHNWYQSRFCEVCCPRSLLPLPQTLRHEREVMQGVREERDGAVMIRLGGDPECLVTPNVRAKRATTAGRQARAGKNVHRTAGPGLVACRWRSA